MDMQETTQSHPKQTEAKDVLGSWQPGYPLGATRLAADSCRFLVWAPRAESVDVHIVRPDDRFVPMERLDQGYFCAVVDKVAPDAHYFYRLNGLTERPDPASSLQPLGVHGPSQVVDMDFSWDDSSWRGLPLEDYVIYELHVGTFSPEGTFDAVIPRLEELKRVGITAIELMPVAQFPGARNWGYDGVYPYAAQNSYGGPDGLRRLVNACHRLGLCVVLDVVYNHLGPEGNCLGVYGPYFTDLYATPWGEAINFDGRYSDEVRRYFVENAVRWVSDFHIDALRLDAIHAIVDPSAFPFLEELGCAVHSVAGSLGRQVYVIPESDRNDARFVHTRPEGGYGLDALWNDDFHHALHVLLTGESAGYYEDFHGIEDLVRAYRDGFVYSGRYSAFRMRRHGNSASAVQAKRFVVFSQNHDQIGNRMRGDRLSELTDLEGLKLAAGAVLLSPFLPLLFMGEEYGEVAPFPYFVSHTDLQLVEAVRNGRRDEFARFAWQGELPDPQAEETFLRARLDWKLRQQGRHRVLCEFYTELLHLRRELPALKQLDRRTLEVAPLTGGKALLLRRWHENCEAAAVFQFGSSPAEVMVPLSRGRWRKVLDSAESRWQGSGSTTPESVESQGNLALALNARALRLFVKIS